jgi:hypothetical protein
MKKVAFLALILVAVVTMPGCWLGCCKKKCCDKDCSTSCSPSHAERISGGDAWGLDKEELDVYKK